MTFLNSIKFFIRAPDPSLPTDASMMSRRNRFFFNRRVLRFLLVALVFLVLLALFRTKFDAQRVRYTLDYYGDQGLPPLYPDHYLKEIQLPQHNPDLPFPEGKTGKYIAMENIVVMAGWGNAMQELLLDAHVAFKAGRSYIFHPYTWNPDGSNFTDYGGHLIPSKVPLTALLAGPVAGDSFPPQYPDAPRAVIKSYFDEVCPHPTVITTDDVNKDVAGDIPADQLLDKWVEKLNSIDDNCVMIDKSSSHMFTFWIFGTAERILPVWPSFSSSPILTHFRWSPLIHRAFTANAHLFTPLSSSSSSFLSSISSLFPSATSSLLLKDSYDVSIPAKDVYTMIPGLLVLHIRRGDYLDHCNSLSNWGAHWNGYNRFPEFIDKFVVPPGIDGSEAKPEVRSHYLEHCLPSMEQIVAKVEEVSQTPEGEGLKYIYVMTNGPVEWVAELKAALGAGGRKWEKIATRRDLTLDWEQNHVSQAVDMLIGQRAQLMIGNGFSSMTSNVVTLRMANGFPSGSIRFW